MPTFVKRFSEVEAIQWKGPESQKHVQDVLAFIGNIPNSGKEAGAWYSSVPNSIYFVKSEEQPIKYEVALGNWIVRDSDGVSLFSFTDEAFKEAFAPAERDKEPHSPPKPEQKPVEHPKQETPTPAPTPVHKQAEQHKSQEKKA